MKSTLFAEDDRSSTAGSHVSILKQYLDLPEEMEETPKLRAIHEESLVLKRPVLRPKIWKVLHSYEGPGSVSNIPNR